MTKKGEAHGAAGDLPATFESEKYYLVRLNKEVRYAGVALHANQTIRMLGSVAQELRDGLASADLIAEQ